MYEGSSKSSKPYPEKEPVEQFCCGNTQPILIKLEKLIQIFLVL